MHFRNGENMSEDIGLRSLELHRKNRGKVGTSVRVNCNDKDGLSLAYTPGVAAVCKEIEKNADTAYDLTMKWNTVAIVSDGTRVLGLGNIGPLAAIPVIEGKAALFKAYANIDAWPICLACKTVDEIVATVKNIAPVFGGINLEDIENPKCFEVENRLKRELDIPVFHDDQHGTAIVVLAGLTNALKVAGKTKFNSKVVIVGAGAAGTAIAKLLVEDGFSNILVCDKNGILVNSADLPEHKEELARLTNKEWKSGSILDALEGADVLIGASSPNIIDASDVKRMAAKPIIFVLSNPIPEIDPALAIKNGAFVVGTARSDMPNQVNNVLGFPGVFRGALMVRAKKVTERMKISAAYALSNVLSDEELTPGRILPDAFDRRVVPAIAIAVAHEAVLGGVARVNKTDDQLREELRVLGLLD